MSKFQAFLLFLFGACCAFSPGIARAMDPPGVPLQLVKYAGPAADLCLQTSRVPGEAQNRVVPATCMEMGGLQMFSFHPVPGGGYRIQNTETFHCLDVEWGANWTGGRILDWPCNNADNQRWEVMYFAGWMKVRGWQSKLCLDVANGIAVQSDCGGWSVEALNVGPAWQAFKQYRRQPDNDHFGLRSAQSKYCMTTDDAPVLGACKGPTHNDLEIEKLDSAATKFRLTKPGDKCLLDYGRFAMYGGCSNAAAWRLVQISPQWGTVPAGINASRWQVQNVATGRCLADSTSVLLMAPCSGTVATTWTPVDTKD